MSTKSELCTMYSTSQNHLPLNVPNLRHFRQPWINSYHLTHSDFILIVHTYRFLVFEFSLLDCVMETFELVDEAKKQISLDLSNKNPQYQVISFTFKTRPSNNKLWQCMGQVVTKATGEWVYLEVPVESDGKVRTKNVYLCACIKPTCFTIYVYNSRDGTSSMTAHTYSRAAAAANSGSLHVWATKKGVPTDSAKVDMTNSLVNMCAWDIRPFALVDRPGFANIIQIALDIGFTSKTPLLAKDLLQSRQTIKHATMDHYDKGGVKTQAIAHKHFKDNGRVPFSIDIWMDKATQTSYSAVTMHLFDNNWVLHAHVVSCDEFSEGMSHTAPTIHHDFVKSVSPFITWKEETETVQAANGQVVVKSDVASNNRGAEGIQS